MAVNPLLVFAVHLLIFIADAVALYVDIFLIDIGHMGFGGKFKFLTFWNICIQTFYFGLCVISDASGEEKSPSEHSKRSKLKRFRDGFHSSVVFPIGMFVVLTFWILYAVDRELVYPKRLDNIIPSWLNHMLHTTVWPFLVLDKVMVYHHHPRRHVGILGASSVALAYLTWILFIAYYDNFWVYPVLEVLQTSERAVFIFVCFLFFSSTYILGESITSFIWRKEIYKQAKKK